MVDGEPKVEWEPKVNRWTGVEIQAVLKGTARPEGSPHLAVALGDRALPDGRDGARPSRFRRQDGGEPVWRGLSVTGVPKCDIIIVLDLSGVQGSFRGLRQTVRFGSWMAHEDGFGNCHK